MASPFNGVSFLLRCLFALALVLGTYNPTEYSYMNWLAGDGFSITPVKALVGVLLLIGWIIFLRATFYSLGWLGIILFGALFGTVIWLLVDVGWLSLDGGSAMTWVIMVLLALTLATGMSWSHIRRRLTGQIDVDDVED
ncbi:MAG: DUF6524 family protein [Gammaproteobacteria bacterium]|jgi:hypothetical protein|nr:DUF6524 family protein [Gammaproteobacteria bacterium]